MADLKPILVWFKNLERVYKDTCTLEKLATLLKGAGLVFDFQKCSKFQKYIIDVLKL